MMRLPAQLQERLIIHSQKCLIRKRKVIEKGPLINFCSNDYLNISRHPFIKGAMIRSLHQHGIGSGSSPLISGYGKPHQQLEETFAEFLNREKAILFNSGYHANLGVISSLANRHSIILTDKLCHASLIDGIILSRAQHYRYRHNDYAHAESIIKNSIQNEQKNTFLIISESIFSIYGDKCNARKLAEIATRARALLVIDDAHGIGILGEEGYGIGEQEQLSQKDIPYLITPFGKALGSFGAVVSGTTEMIEPLLQFARTLHYSTALPPALCDATRAAIHVIQRESWRRHKLYALIQFFIKASKDRQLPLVSDDETPIKTFVVNSNAHALVIQDNLAKCGFLTACIRSPSVPPQSACLRISLNCMHTENQIITLLDYLREQYDALPSD